MGISVAADSGSAVSAGRTRRAAGHGVSGQGDEGRRNQCSALCAIDAAGDAGEWRAGELPGAALGDCQRRSIVEGGSGVVLWADAGPGGAGEPVWTDGSSYRRNVLELRAGE